MIRLLLLIAVSVVGAFGSDEADIKAADAKWAAAVKNRDVATLEQIFTPGLIYAHATGAVQDKTTYINRLKSGKQRYDNVVIETTKVVPYGDAAVSHSVVRTIGTNDQGPFNDHVMMMHLWVRQNGTWRLAAHQTTKIP